MDLGRGTIHCVSGGNTMARASTTLQQQLDRLRFIRGSIEGLIRLSEDEGFDMLAYLLDMARIEGISIEERLAKPE